MNKNRGVITNVNSINKLARHIATCHVFLVWQFCYIRYPKYYKINLNPATDRTAQIIDYEVD